VSRAWSDAHVESQVIVCLLLDSQSHLMKVRM